MSGGFDYNHKPRKERKEEAKEERERKRKETAQNATPWIPPNYVPPNREARRNALRRPFC